MANNLFIDLEFLENGKTVELISIGIVAQDGRAYYAVSSEFDHEAAAKDEWLYKNVLPSLPHSRHWKSRQTIAAEIKEFAGENPVFWGDYASYDWVCLCQLYGRMIDLPEGWPMFIQDVQNWKVALGYDGKFPDAEQEHQALSDAINVLDRYNILLEHYKVQLKKEIEAGIMEMNPHH